MTGPEFFNQFDILYNNSTSNQAPGLNGYEKSVFLTKAEYEVLKNHFNLKSNKLNEGFDDSAKRQIDFSTLIRTIEITPNDGKCILDNNMKKDIFFIINEEAIELKTQNKCVVIPISYSEYDRIQSKPYKYPLKSQIWRLIEGSSTNNANDVITLISHYNDRVEKYIIRYVRRPNPIVLEDDDIWPRTADSIDYTIDGWPKLRDNSSSDTEIPDDDSDSEDIDNRSNIIYPSIDIPEELHDEVLQRAVELAKIAWQGDLTATLTGGQRSE